MIQHKTRREFLSATIPLLAAPAMTWGAGRAGAGLVRVVDHSLVDDGGPFLGLGVSYFTALWRFRHDRPRLERDLAFLSRQGFDFYRMLSMVGHHRAWEGREIAPVSFTSREGTRVEAWPDYARQLRELIDLAFDRHGLRTQITVFADAQIIPSRDARIAHLRTILDEVLPGRESKVVMLEVANEAWQNGFPGEEGVSELREFSRFLNDRTRIPVAITSNHDGTEAGNLKGFDQLYAGRVADLATWHFSRDRRTDDGWKPVYDCWEFGDRPGLPPVSSNEPIGPGSSVDAERDPIRLVMAAAFAFAAKLPMYVFHSEAGVFGKSRFEDTPAIDRFTHLARLLPPDLPSWTRNDGKGKDAPFTAFAGGMPDRYWPEIASARDGCVRNIGGRKGDRFVCVPIGIRPGGLTLQARKHLRFTAHDPLTGEATKTATLVTGEQITLDPGPGGLILSGRILPMDAERTTGI